MALAKSTLHRSGGSRKCARREVYTCAFGTIGLDTPARPWSPMLKSFFSRNPAADIPRAMQRAVALQAQGNLAEAESLCRAILKKDGSHFGALQLLGTSLLQQSRFGESATVLADALRIQPESVDALASRGAALIGVGSRSRGAGHPGCGACDRPGVGRGPCQSCGNVAFAGPGGGGARSMATGGVNPAWQCHGAPCAGACVVQSRTFRRRIARVGRRIGRESRDVRRVDRSRQCTECARAQRRGVGRIRPGDRTLAGRCQRTV